MRVTPDLLDQHLDDPCRQCRRPFLWCECGLPAYVTRDALRGDVASVIRLLDRLAADPGGPEPGRDAVLRVWAAVRRARGWDA